jgi:hypothetical protein
MVFRKSENPACRFRFYAEHIISIWYKAGNRDRVWRGQRCIDRGY